jgi:hypothetical protein
VRTVGLGGRRRWRERRDEPEERGATVLRVDAVELEGGKTLRIVAGDRAVLLVEPDLAALQQRDLVLRVDLADDVLGELLLLDDAVFRGN